MDRADGSHESPTASLSDAQLWAVLRLGGLAFALSFALPLYHAVTAWVPPVASVVPPAVAVVLSGAGLLVGFPAVFGYAHLLARRTEAAPAPAPSRYGVGDQWEREHL